MNVSVTECPKGENVFMHIVWLLWVVIHTYNIPETTMNAFLYIGVLYL